MTREIIYSPSMFDKEKVEEIKQMWEEMTGEKLEISFDKDGRLVIKAVEFTEG